MLKKYLKIMNCKGLTLIELMIAVVVLMVGLLGFLGLQITAITVNEANKRLLVATEAALQEIEAVKTTGYEGLKNQNTNLISNQSYFNSLSSLPADYQMTGIDTSCGSPYDYCVYKGVAITKTVNNNTVTYYNTLKLSVQVNYLNYPTLEKCQMRVSWQYKGELKSMNYMFYVEQKS
jgi:Tfp pilus assembly protein PilV